MKALSIRQPWAWFILCGFAWWKRYENRDWGEEYARAQFRICPPGSDFAIHASKGMTHREFDEACEFAQDAGALMFPRFDEVKRGGIVGITQFVRPVRKSRNRWFTGPIALEMDDPYPVPFMPWQGQLGFFDLSQVSIIRPTGQPIAA